MKGSPPLFLLFEIISVFLKYTNLDPRVVNKPLAGRVVSGISLVPSPHCVKGGWEV